MSADSSDNGKCLLRDRLALERTFLANERTLLAYVRTAIMFVATGATLLKFYSDSRFSVVSGWMLIVAGIGVAAFGATRFYKLSRSLNQSR